jgi:hypothetical protein
LEHTHTQKEVKTVFIKVFSRAKPSIINARDCSAILSESARFKSNLCGRHFHVFRQGSIVERPQF